LDWLLHDEWLSEADSTSNQTGTAFDIIPNPLPTAEAQPTSSPKSNPEDSSLSLNPAQVKSTVEKGRLVIPGRARELLQSFLDQRPYPTKEELEELARKTNLTFVQVKTWFNNNRSRMLKKGM